ncbi:MAG: hypothetical protein KQH53_08540 [Desulfarculaceae bacterium]|nr:hypothetical protein [Desulfarculaceae bacterium]
MKDVDPEQGLDWSSTYCTTITGRRKPDWLQPGDVLFLMRGRNNFAVHIAHVPSQAVCSPQFMLLRVKLDSGLLPEFLAWQINQIPAQKCLHMASEGTLQTSIRRGELEHLPLVVPPIVVQKTVVQLDQVARQEAGIYRELIANRQRMMHAVAKKVLEEDEG